MIEQGEGMRSVFALTWVGGYTYHYPWELSGPGLSRGTLLFCLLDAGHSWQYMKNTEAQLVRDPIHAMTTSEGLVCPDCFFSRRHGTEGMARTRSDQ